MAKPKGKRIVEVVRFSRGYSGGRVLFSVVSLILLITIRIGFSQSEQRQLKDIFDLQWLVGTRGRPEEVTDANRLSLTAGVPFFVTTNPALNPDGGRADLYFGPWVTVEWRTPMDEQTSWYAGASFADYQYLRFPENNSAFAELSLGLNRTILRSRGATLSGYAVAACDYNMNPRFSQDDWEASLSLGANLAIDLGRGHSFYFTPDFTILAAFPQSAISNSYLSCTPTLGWIWQATPSVMIGAYWSGRGSYYPRAGDQFDMVQYLGLNLDWQATPALSIGLTCIETVSTSTNASSCYSDLTAGLTIKTQFPTWR